MAEILILRRSPESWESGTPYKKVTDVLRWRGFFQQRRTFWAYQGKMILRRGDPLLLCQRYTPHRRHSIGLVYRRGAKMRLRLNNNQCQRRPQGLPTCGLRHHPDGGTLIGRAHHHPRHSLRERVVLNHRLKTTDSPQPKRL